MNETERDTEVDAWLESRRSLRRAPDETNLLEPPPELDRLIIERAHLELRRPASSRIEFFRNPRWSLPLSIAATLLLSFTLVLQFDRYQSRRDAASALNAPPAASVTVTPPFSVAPQAESTDALSAASAPTGAISGNVATTAVPPASKALGSSRNRAEQTQLVASDRPERDAQRATGGALPSPAAAFGRARREAVSEPDQAVAAGTATESAVASSASASPVPASPLAASAMADSLPTNANAASDKPTAGFAAPPAAEAHRSVKSWWEYVLTLRRQAHTEDAARELTALRKAYPDFVVPTTP